MNFLQLENITNCKNNNQRKTTGNIYDKNIINIACFNVHKALNLPFFILYSIPLNKGWTNEYVAKF